ncbi:MAG: LemA family protein, partial [Candidatus Rokubacteria bacterium]|nr:LemA family protein [Candidatus Rokubacteria bacterium]
MNRTILIVLGVIVLVVLGGIGWAVGVNNALVARDQDVKEKWAQVQNVYQRRADLVPNLVETVKGFAAQERTVLDEVTRARASVAGIKATPELLNDPQALQKFQQAQSEL